MSGVWKTASLSPLFLALIAGCAAPVQSVSGTDSLEWRRRADGAQEKYQELSKQVDRLLEVMPRAAGVVEPVALKKSFQDHRQVGELTKAIERQISEARDGTETAGRYRLAIRCGTDKEDGSYTVGLVRKGTKPKAKGGRIKILDRALCPSSASVVLSPQQVAAGDYRLEIAFESRPERPYNFSFELRKLEGDEVVCSGGTTSGGAPSLSNSCDLALRVQPAAELPVAR